MGRLWQLPSRGIALGLSEAETRTQLIDVLLRAAGWDDGLIDREYFFAAGKVELLGDEATREDPQFADYVLRAKPGGPAVAVVEAKSEDHAPGSGLQQAIAYSQGLGIPFALSSNGHGVVLQDLGQGTVSEGSSFPQRGELVERYRSTVRLRDPDVTTPDGRAVKNPHLIPGVSDPLGRRLRYYQERAVAAAIDEILLGRRRALLSLATGTGKTLVASTVAWKLVKSGYASKVLFLADRVNLRRQAYNAFAGFGDARAVVGAEPTVPLNRDIHFATYQTLYADGGGGGTFLDYPSDYFDLIIVDECHRSGYGDWGVILGHFDSAFHLGLTATPKRTDSIDTYEFFAAENRDQAGNPLPAYEYSFGRGIADGFLANYQVHRITTNVDSRGLSIESELSRGAELYVPEDSSVRDIYKMSQFEREIVVPDRTAAICDHLAQKLHEWGPSEKTIVYCVTMEHALQVRNELQNRLGPVLRTSNYAVRIVSEERDGATLLENFQLSTSTLPAVATTVDLLTTGIDIPSLRNVVFMRTVSSPTLFKQIIGRGSRIDEEADKLFFRIIDYTGATRLFDEWDVPPASDGDEPLSGHASIRGCVVDASTSNPIAGVAVSIRHESRELDQAITDSVGEFAIEGLPEATVSILAGGVAGYARAQRRVQLLAGDGTPELLIELRQESSRVERLRITGVEVVIENERTMSLSFGGQQYDRESYLDHAGAQIREELGDEGALTRQWRDSAQRSRLREHLRERNADPELIRLATGRSDADEVDLLASTGFGSRLRSRDDRARDLYQRNPSLLQTDELRRAIIDSLIDQYRLGGVTELTSTAFSLPAFDPVGGLRGVLDAFGGAEGVADLLRELQAELYPILPEKAA